jgi:RecJ-like exonuclease
MTPPAVLVEVHCPACDGAGCVEAPPRYRVPCDTCQGLGSCTARLVSHEEMADTDPAPPMTDRESRLRSLGFDDFTDEQRRANLADNIDALRKP